MKSMWKFLLSVVAVAVFTFGISSPSMAQISIYNYNGDQLQSSTDNAYKIAYEIYSNVAGLTTSSAQMNPVFTQKVADNDTITLNITSGNADFAAPKSVFHWVIWVDNTTGTYEVAQSQAVGQSAYLTFTVDNATAFNANLNTNKFYIGQTDGTTYVKGVGLVLPAGLNPSCSNMPIIKITMADNHETTGSYALDLAYMTPQFGASWSSSITSYVNAELDADTDFATFKTGGTPETVSTTQVGYPSTASGNLLTVTNNYDNTPIWIAYSNAVDINVGFDITSAADEGGIPDDGVEAYVNNNGASVASACTYNGNNVWHCNVTAQPGNKIALSISLDGTSTDNNPTTWTLNNVSFNAASSSVPLCLTSYSGSIGNWYGGLEAIVPFVKYNPSVNAETYIVLSNRYSKPAKLYVADMLSNSNSLITTKTQIPGFEEIQPGQSVKISGADLAKVFPNADFASGVPIKFMIKVPTQSIEPTEFAFQDPYIEGIVVSVYGSTQRSVPLEFRYWTNGSYQQ